MSPPKKPNGRNPRRTNRAHRPDPPTRLLPCRQLFEVEGCSPHDFKKKWEIVLKEYGMTLEQGLPEVLSQEAAAIIDLCLIALNEYLNANHPRHADLKAQDAYALFFPLISEAVLTAACAGFSHKTEAIKELEQDLALADFKARNID